MTFQANPYSKLEWDQVDELLVKKVVHGEHMTATRYRFSGGGTFPNHEHPQEQMTFLIDGSITFHLEGNSHALIPGDLIVIPAQVAHSALAGANGAEVLSMVSPPRSDGDRIAIIE